MKLNVIKEKERGILEQNIIHTNRILYVSKKRLAKPSSSQVLHALQISNGRRERACQNGSG